MSPHRILMGPGPSDTHPRVLAALAQPTVGHLDPYYLQLMNQMQERLRQVLETTNELTLAVSGTGSAGMEAAVVNLVEPGTKMLVCVNGVFGARMADVAQRVGATVFQLEKPWGEVFSPEEIEAALRQHQPDVTGIILAETSTGAWQPVEEIARRVHDHGGVIIVDAVTGLGGVPVRTDAWELDCVYSGTQKCLGCPPGLAPITFGPRARQRIAARRTKVQSWYLDMTMIAQYWGQDRVYHHTAPINMTYALNESLAVLLEEGLSAAHTRHLRQHRALAAGLAALGIDYVAAVEHRLPMLNAVRIPPGVDDATVRRELLARFGIEIGGGLGPFKGKVWRIGLMGYGADSKHVLLFLAALEQILLDQGLKFAPGSSIAAANDVYRFETE
ncbi:MAG: alanine--glyoxylate aminotransferase family protein [Pirellulales bacterium]|nr:alanine--glyoxylate aminotransferase family protein [Pirellulales bacterium]